MTSALTLVSSMRAAQRRIVGVQGTEEQAGLAL